jgi:hypothetical protein
MILKYNVQRKDKFVPKIRGRYLEWVGNLEVYFLTKDPGKASRFSTKDKAKKAIKEYRKFKWRVV